MWSEGLLTVAFLFSFIVAWGTCLAAGFLFGRRMEQGSARKGWHVAISGGATLVLAMIIALYMLGTGSLGPKSEWVLRSEYCTRLGYTASSMPPRTSGARMCSSLDASGSPAITLPMELLRSAPYE